jgi:cobalt-zinc-cadmium efflux system outer membrane protein
MRKHFWLLCCLLSTSLYGHLSFEEAIDRTLANSPALSIAADGVGAYEGISRQSRLYPNPIVGYTAENLYGNKDWHGWNAAEVRYEIAQLIELGGKRGYRSNAAHYQFCASVANYQAQQMAVLNQLLKAYIDVAALQEQVKLTEEHRLIAEEVFKTVSAKVEAGKVSLIQQNKAEIAFATAVIENERIHVGYANAKERLALFWGASCPDFDTVEYPFYAIDPGPSLEDWLKTLDTHPELIAAQFECSRASHQIAYEKAGAIPDVVVSVGYKTLQETHNKGMIVGASLPLPIANQNQGNVQRAQFEMQRAQDEYTVRQLQLEKTLSIAHKGVMRAFQEAVLLRTTVLATAEKSFKFAQEGYKEGKFEYLDMLDSQKTLFEVKERYIQALLNYHKNKADLTYPTSKEPRA